MNPTITPKKDVGRNELCPCNSGLKFKLCHGDVRKQAVCESVMIETMVRLIAQEQFKHDLITEEQLEMILNPKGETDEREESRIIHP